MAYRSDTLRVVCGQFGGDHQVCGRPRGPRKRAEPWIVGERGREGYVEEGVRSKRCMLQYGTSIRAARTFLELLLVVTRSY